MPMSCPPFPTLCCPDIASSALPPLVLQPPWPFPPSQPVWAFDLEELKWTPLGPKPGHSAPPPRGGHPLALTADQLFIFGGYYVKKDAPDPGEGRLV